MYSVTGFPGTMGRTCHPLPFRTLLCILIILVLALAAPATAAVWTISPGDSIQTAINSAGDWDTIILNPGTYNQNGITVSKNITIRANTSAGGTAADTVIDGGLTAGIFTVSYVTFAIDNLTLKDGMATEGGAIDSNGPLTISSSTFENCSAPYGGAISSESGGTLTI